MPFVPTPAEVALVNQIFTQADPQKLGVVTGEQGVKIFAGSHLPPAFLGDIWSLADPENNGVLTRKGVAIAIRLIGWAQSGEQPSNELLEKVGPLPVIDGVVVPAVSAPAKAPAPITTLPSILPPLLPTDRTKFLTLFNKQNPTGGLLSGEVAKTVFVRSKLPVERLNAIWNLVDTQNRGSLDATQFVLAMYLIQGSMTANPTIPVLPPSIPPFLWEQAGGRPPSVHSHTTGESLPSPTFQSSMVHKGFMPQYTGSSILPLNQQTTGSTHAMTPLVAQGTGSRTIPSRPSNLGLGSQLTGSPFPLARSPAAPQIPWDVTAEEKARTDGFFDSLDTAKAGYIEGGAAVPFMLLSNLPEETLARVWDLADMKNDGRLTKETFAVAMHLINGVLEGKELPNVLPVTLIPPSVRGSVGLPSAPAAPVQVLSQAQQDLLSLDEDISSPPVKATSPPPIISQISGSAFHSNLQSPAPAPAPVPAPVPVPAPAPALPTFGRDLLEDEEAEGRQMKQLNDNNVEIANLRNQLSSTSNAQATVQQDRTQLEADLSTSASTLSQLKTQLASAKIGYDTESKLLADLRERYTAQATEIQTTRDELIRAESDLSALKLEKTEIGGNLLREKEDVRELKRRVGEVAQEVESIKKEIEQAKKDARMQKGLLAIAKKQLSSAEAEKEAAQKELLESKAEAEQAEAEVAQTEAAITALKESTTVASPPKAASPIPSGERDAKTPGSPPVTSPILPYAEPSRIGSPTPSTSSRNPFDRFRQGSVSSLTTPQRAGSPFAAAHVPIAEAHNDSAEQDDPFGFNETAEAPAVVLSPIEPTLTTGTDTPRQQIVVPNGSLVAPTSPEQEKLISPAETFFTPPTSSAGNANIDDLFVDTDDATASRFPALNEATSPKDDTELPPLKDIENTEEDSSSDDEDNRPLGEVKAEKQATAAITAPETQKHAAKESVATEPSFDDMFGTSNATATAPNSHFSTLGSSAASPTTSGFQSQTAPPVVNGQTTGTSAVNAFDEAMGIAPAAPAETKPSNEFKFEEFDDTFNFGDASFGHASKPSQDMTAPSASAAFDDAFGFPTSAAGQSGTTGGANPGLSFEDAFEVDTNGPQLQQAPQLQQQTQPPPQPEAPITFPIPQPYTGAPAGPTSAAPQDQPVQNGAAKGTPSVRSGSPVATRDSASSARPSSPPLSATSHQQQQQAIPPARPRPPKDGAKPGNSLAPEAAGASRSSRLSIHFPFGRSKSSKDKKDKKDKDKHSKDHDKHEARPPMPTIPGSYSASTDRLEEQAEVGTPTEDGDIPVLKQLMSLGFDRERSVAALEASNYNFQRALNKLLASQ